MKPIVEFTQDMRDTAYDFAYKLETKNNQYPRLGQKENELIETTFIGKLGELAVLSYLNQNGKFPDTEDMFKIFEGQENVDSCDFQLKDGKTVDVKTGYLEYHKRLMVNQSQLDNSPKDIYIGVKLFTASASPKQAGNTDKNAWVKAEINGWTTHDKLASVKTRYWGHDYAYALFYTELDSIETLLQLF